MMKKILGVMATGMVLVSVPSVAFAQENIDENLNKDFQKVKFEPVCVKLGDGHMKTLRSSELVKDGEEVVNSGFCPNTFEFEFKNVEQAELAFLKLKRNVEMKVVLAEAVVDLFESKGEDVIELNELVLAMNSYVEEIDSVDFSGDLSELNVDFKEIRDENMDLVTQFRKIVENKISEEDRKSLRETVKESEKEIKDRYKELIEEKKVDSREKRMEAFFEKTGIDFSSIAEEIKNGEMSAEELRAKFMEFHKDLNKEQKQKIFQVTKERKVKFNVMKDKRDEIFEKRVDGLVERRGSINKKLKELREKHQDKFKEMKENRREKFDEMKEKHQIDKRVPKMSEEEKKKALETLENFAETGDVSEEVLNEIEKVNPRMAAAIKEGKLDQEQAKKMLEQIKMIEERKAVITE